MVQTKRSGAGKADEDGDSKRGKAGNQDGQHKVADNEEHHREQEKGAPSDKQASDHSAKEKGEETGGKKVKCGPEGPTIQIGHGSAASSPATFGFALLEGKRGHKIEDFHVAEVQKMGNQELGFFAVFDGHAGRHVSKFLRNHLLDNIKEHPALKKGNYLKAVREAFISTDEDIVEREKELDVRGGSTAITALLVDGKELIVANLGDSRAVMGRKGKAEQLSVDHKPDKPEERKQVEEKGGKVVNKMGVWRVDATLAMSRAFGDKDIKDHLSSEPHIREVEVTKDTDCLILASDGLWDVVSNQDAIDIALKVGSPEDAARALVHEAYKRKSNDDITAVVVFFKATPDEKHESKP